MERDPVATVTIRNIDERIVKKLKMQAKTNNRSLEAELREILSAQVREREHMQRFLAKADRIAAMTPKVPQTDSALLLREDRDR
jgi:plasmid stability protein